MCVQKDRAFENPVSRKQSADPEEVSDQASLTANTLSLDCQPPKLWKVHFQ